ncbi:MAG: metallophosphoesterase, partial [Eubacteriales bacterium]|nr:metallophosphoesterase [Eubacteriales bacterium]
MSIYAISDLHLSFKDEKDMSIFSDIWKSHSNKIKENWQKNIKNDDLIIISGDTSWAKNLKDAMLDLDFINSLNGKKIIGYGNHDYWWNSTNKLNSLYDNIFFLKNNYYIYNNYVICGTRGW